MWQKFRKREEAIKAYYKDKGEPARDHLPRTAVDGVISWEPVSMHWNIILSLHLETMPCWVWLQVCQRKERSCQDVIIPPHPTPPNLETMPCWVWLQVCQRKERNCQDVIIPPHPTPPPRIWRRCHVECGHKCVRGRNAAARTLLSHPTPPPRIWRRCHVECGCKCDRGRNAPPRTLLSHPTPPHLETMPCWVWPQVCQRKERSCQDVIIPPHPTPLPRIWRRCHVECGRKCVRGRNAAARTLLSHPTPPHPASGDDAMLTVAAIVTRMLVSESCGWWLGNGLFLVVKSSCFGCGIAFFWLRNRLFLVAKLNS